MMISMLISIVHISLFLEIRFIYFRLICVASDVFIFFNQCETKTEFYFEELV